MGPVALPVPAVVRSTAAGDDIVSPASGDPFFLGFAAGPYHPPEGQRLDPAFAELAVHSGGDGRPHEDTYGFAMFQKRMTRQRLAELEALGVRFL